MCYRCGVIQDELIIQGTVVVWRSILSGVNWIYLFVIVNMGGLGGTVKWVRDNEGYLLTFSIDESCPCSPYEVCIEGPICQDVGCTDGNCAVLKFEPVENSLCTICGEDKALLFQDQFIYEFQDPLPNNTYLKYLTVYTEGTQCANPPSIIINEIHLNDILIYNDTTNDSECSCMCHKVLDVQEYGFGPGNYWPDYNYGGLNSFAFKSSHYWALIGKTKFIFHYESKLH